MPAGWHVKVIAPPLLLRVLCLGVAFRILGVQGSGLLESFCEFRVRGSVQQVVRFGV